MLRRVQTRRVADLLCRLFNGDMAAATPWYRLEYAAMCKLTRNPALAAASSAYHLGVPASAVWADPTTGEPFHGPLAVVE